MRVRDDCYTKNHLSIYNRGVQATIKRAEDKSDESETGTTSVGFRILFQSGERKGGTGGKRGQGGLKKLNCVNEENVVNYKKGDG